jgi:UPF0755 protein
VTRFLGGLLLALVLVGLGGAVFVSHWLSPLAQKAESLDFRVEPGSTLGSVARDLERSGLVRSARAFEWLGRYRGVAAELRSGEYDLSSALAAREILDRLVEGRVRTYEVAIPEGWSAAQIARRLHERGLAEQEEFLVVARDPTVALRLGVEGDTLEGYLFPETYHLARGLDAEEVATTFVGEFLARWDELAPLAQSQGRSMKEVVTLASIVEKETGAEDERPLIAAVFLNRLARRMRLESDPTTIYGIPDFDGNLRRAHLEDEGNPYNTYRISALPPGPIANPGLDALRAALEPSQSDYLYFVSRNDGTHYFSRTYREHLEAVDRFQRRR